jgi:ribosome biogenesis GTPase
MKGLITKGIGGFYYVSAENEIIELKPMVGDFVEIDEKQGYILQILERKNELIRPPLANVDKNIIVFASKSPDLNLGLLDKFLIMSEYKKLKTAICINKCDIDGGESYQKVKNIYEKIGYPVFSASISDETAIQNMKNFIGDSGVTIFSGQSGVGKSTIINRLKPDLLLKTGAISERLKKGKHTTRHVELFPVNNGYVADTPGFSSFELSFMGIEDVRSLYVEFNQYEDKCAFYGCSHISEPKCGVKDALKEGLIDRDRYNRYVEVYTEMKNNKPNY